MHDIEKITEHARSHIDKVLRSNQSLNPFVFLHKGSDIVAFDMAPHMESDASKNEARHLLIQIIKLTAPEYFVFVSEAWMTLAVPDEPFVRPSQSPRRQEIAIIQVETSAGESKLSIFHIKRNEDGSGYLGERQDAGMELENRWSGLFLEAA